MTGAGERVEVDGIAYEIYRLDAGAWAFRVIDIDSGNVVGIVTHPERSEIVRRHAGCVEQAQLRAGK